MKTITPLLILFFLLTLCLYGYGQESTYEQVYNILQSDCSGCHGGDNPRAKLDFSGDLSTVYDILMNQEVINAYGKENGLRLVEPGYPDRSVLFRKCNNNLYPSVKLHFDEGSPMPTDLAPPLANEEIELIRQWILFGAPEEEVVVDPELIAEFYNGGGLDRLEQPQVPNPSEGIQIYMGPVFLAPGEEYEFHKKHDLQLDKAVEVNRIELFMNDFSHHCALFKYNEDAPPKFSPAIRPVNSIIDNYEYFFETTFLINSQYPELDLRLPATTAFFWDAGTHIDLNYHIKNYSSAGILAAEFYINIYTQNTGKADYEMFSETVNYGGSNPFALSIDNNSKDTTFVMEHLLEDQEETRYYWLMQGHTHQTAIDYDMFKRNSDGSKGEQIYEGFFDANYQFDQGYWDFAYPPLLQNDPLLAINMQDGLIMEATYNNTTDKKRSFGLTTNDEMFAGYLLYTLGQPIPNAIPPSESNPFSWQIAPNPANSKAMIQYHLPETAQVAIQLYDLMGHRLQSLQSARLQAAGKHVFSLETVDLTTGTYFVELEIDGIKQVSKLIVE